MTNFKEKANFIWSVADLLRGAYKQADYGKVILPLTVMRRLDQILEPTKAKVLELHNDNKKTKPELLELMLNKAAKQKFHNRSKFTFRTIVQDHRNIAANLRNYINGYSVLAQEIVERFEFDKQIHKLEENDLLFLVMERFAELDLSKTDAMEMGYIYEELIRKFAELSNETAGEHFTPREVIKLMVNLLFDHEDAIFKEGIIKTVYDPTCGTGGMLSVAHDHIIAQNPQAKVELFGQELNSESYAICKSDMLIKGQNPANVIFGNSFTNDGHDGKTFNYMLANPPFGVEWKKEQKFVQDEADKRGYAGRFGAGLPRINDGSLMFLQHMISKMKSKNGEYSRIAIVFNGSPLFTGGAGSGESEIRKWIIENDWLEAIVALPDQLFYNTGISTYIWILTNGKEKQRKGKVQLINAASFFEKMLRSLGNKRNIIADEQIKKITKIYGAFRQSEHCKIFRNNDFGYSRITLERPTRDEQGNIVTDKKGNPKPNADLRDFENVPLSENIADYFQREVIPHAPDAWIDESKTKIGYEINFTKYFYQYKPLRSLEAIRADILALEQETDGLLKEVLKQ